MRLGKKIREPRGGEGKKVGLEKILALEIPGLGFCQDRANYQKKERQGDSIRTGVFSVHLYCLRRIGNLLQGRLAPSFSRRRVGQFSPAPGPSLGQARGVYMPGSQGVGERIGVRWGRSVKKIQA